MTECMLNNLEEFVIKFKEQSTFDKKKPFSALPGKICRNNFLTWLNATVNNSNFLLLQFHI